MASGITLLNSLMREELKDIKMLDGYRRAYADKNVRALDKYEVGRMIVWGEI